MKKAGAQLPPVVHPAVHLVEKITPLHRLLRWLVVIGLLFGALFGVIAAASVRNALLLLIGYGLGVALILGKIGFTSTWRSFITGRDGRPMLNQVLLLGLASLAIFPLLAKVEGTVGNITPFGLSVAVGAFLFGLGMQLGDGCGSGTLASAGSGKTHSLVALGFFIIGSVVGSLHLPWWLPHNGFAPFSLVQAYSLERAFIIQLLLLAALAMVVFLSCRRRKVLMGIPTRQNLIGAVGIALLAAAALYVGGRMWAITFGYTLWGAKMAESLGIDLAQHSAFWNWSFPAQALANNVLVDITSVMNFGLFLGTASCALLKRQNTFLTPMTGRQVGAAAIGGLLMGYGARLAFGCNIGAYFSGIASGSLHGWVWLGFAFGGTLLGVRLRPYFSLSNNN